MLVVSPSDQLVEGELVATKNWQSTIAANTPKKRGY
jgi:hypothetical protein